MNTDNVKVTNNEAEGRFEAPLDGAMAVAEYTRAGDRIIFTDTEVPPEMEGQGIGGKLVRTALEYARDQGLGVWPVCPFVRSYIEQHPEYQDLVLRNRPHSPAP